MSRRLRGKVRARRAPLLLIRMPSDMPLDAPLVGRQLAGMGFRSMFTTMDVEVTVVKA